MSPARRPRRFTFGTPAVIRPGLFPRPHAGSIVGAGALAAALFLAAGCASPLEPRSAELASSLIESVRRELAEAERSPETRMTERPASVAALRIDPQFMPELERMAGPNSYDKTAIETGDVLVGAERPRVAVSLERVVRTTVENNLEVQFARIAPAISSTAVTASEAAFDWTFFSTGEAAKVDEPRTSQRSGVSTFGLDADVRNTAQLTTGLRRRVESGGQFSLQHELLYSDNDTPGLLAVPNPANQEAVVFQFDQPLLRGFGTEVSLAQIRLDRNAERDSIAQLKADLIRVVTEAERAYWDLFTAQRDLLILQRLRDRGIGTRERVIARKDNDAKPSDIADAIATVERRNSDIIRAQRAVAQASDRLKVLMNDPSMPVGSEVLLLPADEAIDAPLEFSLIDSLLLALNNRPELQQAVLSLDSAGIRLSAAVNARLPRLDLRLQARYNALEDDYGAATRDLVDGQFINYLMSLQFEQPVGNREAEALFRRRWLEQQQARIAYQNTVQRVSQEVVSALRDVLAAYRLIEQARVSRIASAEALRSFTVENDIRGLTPERLNLEFNRQEALSQAERTEAAAMAAYSTSIANLYAATGTALEHNQVEFKVEE